MEELLKTGVRVVDLNDPQGREDMRVVIGCLVATFSVGSIFLAVATLVDMDNRDRPREVLNFLFTLLYLLFQTSAFLIVSTLSRILLSQETFAPFERGVEVSYRKYGLVTIIVLLSEILRQIVFYLNLNTIVSVIIFCEMAFYAIFNIDMAIDIYYWSARRPQRFSKIPLFFFIVTSVSGFSCLTMVSVAATLE